jgi:hypothetical protein
LNSARRRLFTIAAQARFSFNGDHLKAWGFDPEDVRVCPYMKATGGE